MINHTRTLLLNVKGPHMEQVGIPGDVYIPEYEPLVLSSKLSNVYTVLFGDNPDYDGKLYRISQYMGLLHSTEYAPYVTSVDPRITYDPDNLTMMSEGLFAVTVTGPSGLKVIGSWETAGADCRAITTWRVRTLSSDTVRVVNMVSGKFETYYPGDTKYLVGSEYRLTFDNQPYTPGVEWFVKVRARPLRSLGEVLATLRILPMATSAEVFGDISKEPNKTFYNLYTHHYACPYQLSGFLFAYVNKLEGIRTHDNVS